MLELNLSKADLLEASRQDLLIKSRRGSKQRYQKRLNYQITNFRGVDLSKLFNDDYFVFQTPINEYVCTVAFPGVLTQLRKNVRNTYGDARRINLQMVIRSIRQAFDLTDDVKVRCTCADFKYRFMYWADHYGYLYGALDPGTEEFPEIRNPDDNLGATCKHLDKFLSNKNWLTKAASTVNALIKAYPDKAAHYLYDEEDIATDEEEEEVIDEVPEEAPVEEPVEEQPESEKEEENKEESSDEDESSEK